MSRAEPVIEPNANITLPVVFDKHMINFAGVDDYYNDFRAFFAFDDQLCCKALPDPDETVFVSIVSHMS
jgi:hypothetical protein